MTAGRERRGEVAVGQDPALSILGLIAVEVSSFVAPSAATTATTAGGSLGTMMYFCAARNEKLLGYWDTVEDRLYKTAPLLGHPGAFPHPGPVRPADRPGPAGPCARGGGGHLRCARRCRGSPTPLPILVLAQKATELASEVRALGSALLTALEKRDGEALATILKPTQGASLFRLFSMRQEFPDQWHRLLSGTATKLGPLELDRRRFPLLFGGKRLIVIASREYHLVTKQGITPLSTVQTGGLEVELKAPATTQKITVAEATQRVDLAIDPGQPDSLPVDLLVICRYTAEKPQP